MVIPPDTTIDEQNDSITAITLSGKRANFTAQWIADNSVFYTDGILSNEAAIGPAASTLMRNGFLIELRLDLNSTHFPRFIITNGEPDKILSQRGAKKGISMTVQQVIHILQLPVHVTVGFVAKTDDTLRSPGRSVSWGKMMSLLTSLHLFHPLSPPTTVEVARFLEHCTHGDDCVGQSISTTFRLVLRLLEDPSLCDIAYEAIAQLGTLLASHCPEQHWPTNSESGMQERRTHARKIGTMVHLRLREIPAVRDIETFVSLNS